MYVNIMPKGETEGLLAFMVPSAHRHTALNGVHQDAGHQGQQRTLVLAEECFWWPKNGGRLSSLSERLPVLPNI